jgi:hypothetical protein
MCPIPTDPEGVPAGLRKALGPLPGSDEETIRTGGMAKTAQPPDTSCNHPTLFIPRITDSHFPFHTNRLLIVDMNTKPQPAGKPVAATEKETLKTMAAAVGSPRPAAPAPQGQTGTPKREYPTLGYE